MPLLERVRGALHGLLPVEDGTDGECLTRFTTAHDETAFAELVRRHGPMVHGVARRILGNGADADDTLQATFFVLARKASAVRTPELVRAWLYGVAVKTAHRLRQQALKRRLRQMAVAKPEAVTPVLPEADWWAVVDAEIAALPDALRQVFLTCDVGGQSRSQAAKELGWPEGTVAKRLAKARVELAKRLTKRGLTLSVPALAATMASDTVASVPTGLLAATIQQALAFGLRTGTGPLGVQTLAESVLMGMKASALKAWAGVGLLLALLSSGLIWAGGGAPPEGKNSEVKDVPKASAPAKPDVGWREKNPLEFVWLPGSLAYSADGTKLVVGGTGGNVSVHEAATLKKLWATKVNADFSAVTFHQGSGAVVATFKDGAIFLNGATGKEGIRIEEKDSNPVAVADLPSFEIVPAEGLIGTQHRLAFGNARGYFFKEWRDNKLATLGSIHLNVLAKDKQPADLLAVPLAADPSGRCLICTGPIHAETKKNVLWAYVAGDYSKESPGNRLMEGHEGRVVSAAWSKDGTTAATGDDKGRVIYWNTKTMKEVRRVETAGRVVALALTADGKKTAAAVIQDRRGVLDAYLQEVYVWDSATPPKEPKPLLTELKQKYGVIHASIAFAPDGQELACCFANPLDVLRQEGVQGKVHVLKMSEKPSQPKPPKVETPPATPAPVGKWVHDPIISDPEFDIQSLSVAGDNKTFAVTSANKTFVYDITSRKRLFRVNGQLPAFAKDSLFTWDEQIVKYDATTGKQKDAFPPDGKPARGHTGAFSTDGKRVLVYDGLHVDIHTANDKTITLEGLPSDLAKVPPTFRGHGFAWSPDSTKVAGFGMNEKGETDHLGVWDATTGKLIARQFKDDKHWTATFACFAWHPDGKHLVVAGQRTDAEQNTFVQLLDATTLKEVPDKQILVRSRDGGADVTALAVAPDGKTVALATNLHSGKAPLVRVLLWTIGTTEITDHLLPEHDTPKIMEIAFTPDQRTILAATSSRAMEKHTREILHRVLLWRWEVTK